MANRFQIQPLPLHVTCIAERHRIGTSADVRVELQI
jgi:hypothetical protein